MSRKKHSTVTISDNGDISPWLSFSGELAYTPESPPLKDYFFQYRWILPSIVNPDNKIKRYYYFGYPGKDIANAFLFDFWNKARNGGVDKVAVYYGRKIAMEFKAPMAIYHWQGRDDNQLCYLFIQHGSYQLISAKEQPYIDNGNVVIYRGIGKAKQFNGQPPLPLMA